MVTLTRGQYAPWEINKATDPLVNTHNGDHYHANLRSPLTSVERLEDYTRHHYGKITDLFFYAPPLGG